MATVKQERHSADLVEKKDGIDEVESIPAFANLSAEDAQWLADFPEDRKKQVVKKVCQAL